MTTGNISIRAPYPDEMFRVKSSMSGKQMPDSASFLVLVKEQPVERLAAVLAYWKGQDEIVFHLENQGPLNPAVWQHLLKELPRLAKESGTKRCSYGSPVTEGGPVYQLLQAAGFIAEPSDVLFHVPVTLPANRITRNYQKIRHRIPENWRVRNLSGVTPRALIELIRPHRIMAASRFLRGWPMNGAAPFDPDFSAVLYEDGKLIACILTTRGDDYLFIDAECCSTEHPKAKMLANAVLLHHVIARTTPEFPSAFRFQANSGIHRQTVNVSSRMGGWELSPRHRMTLKIMDEDPVCGGCGKEAATVIDGKGLCVDCFQACGSCCSGE